MSHLTLTDNNFANPVSLTTLLKDDVQAQIHAYEDLQLVANKNLKALCKNQSLLVFPHCLGEHDDYNNSPLSKINLSKSLSNNLS